MTNSGTLQPNKTKKGFTYEKQKFVLAMIFLLPWVVGLLLFFIFPFFQSLVFSLFQIKPVTGGLEMSFVGIQNYVDIFTSYVYDDTSFSVEILNTIQAVAINIPVMIIFSLFMATMLNTEFRGRGIVRAIFFIPVILNSAAVLTVLSSSTGAASELIFNQGGLSKAFDLQLFLVDAGLPKEFIEFIVTLIDRIYDIITLSGVPILLFLSSIQSIPKHLYEAARIEGATSYEMFWLITLPNVKPHIITVVIYGIVDTFMTSPVSTLIAREFNLFNWGTSTSMSWVYVGTIIGILLIFAVIAKIFKLGESHYE